MSAKEFSLDLGKAYDNLLEEQFLPFKQAIAMKLLRGVVFKTPVDTGRARGNWVVSLESPDNSSSEGVDKVGGQTISTGANVVFSDRDPFAAVYIQNNLPYIQRLENGYSTEKAPLGMVAVTLAEIGVSFT